MKKTCIFCKKELHQGNYIQKLHRECRKPYRAQWIKGWKIKNRDKCLSYRRTYVHHRRNNDFFILYAKKHSKFLKLAEQNLKRAERYANKIKNL